MPSAVTAGDDGSAGDMSTGTGTSSTRTQRAIMARTASTTAARQVVHRGSGSPRSAIMHPSHAMRWPQGTAVITAAAEWQMLHGFPPAAAAGAPPPPPPPAPPPSSAATSPVVVCAALASSWSPPTETCPSAHPGNAASASVTRAVP